MFNVELCDSIMITAGATRCMSMLDELLALPFLKICEMISTYMKDNKDHEL